MSFSTDWRYDAGDYDYRRLAPNARAQRRLAGAALASVALACGWTLWVNLTGPRTDQIFSDQVEVVGTRGDRLAAPAPTPSSRVAAAATVVNNFVSLFDPRYFSGSSPGTFARIAALRSDSAGAPQPANQQAQASSATPPTTRSIVQSAASPVPPLRLTDARNASTHDSTRANRAVAAATPDQQPTIFERLFGKSSPLTLAYAAPDDGGLAAGANVAGRYDSETAVYDISAHVVYLPDGTRLEAHSGYGSMLDDPRHADAKDRGVTPPDVYDLELREAPFHGVRALRLKPVDESKVFGRSGLLAHSFMLGPNGDSNGCVSFRNYDAFLQAYLKHEIKKLAVVARLD
jgi:Protein of unknown function (DUF2778)